MRKYLPEGTRGAGGRRPAGETLTRGNQFTGIVGGSQMLSEHHANTVSDYARSEPDPDPVRRRSEPGRRRFTESWVIQGIEGATASLTCYILMHCGGT